MRALTLDDVKAMVGQSISDHDAAALAAWYAAVEAGVAVFPEAELKGVEPPLRSTPGPDRR